MRLAKRLAKFKVLLNLLQTTLVVSIIFGATPSLAEKLASYGQGDRIIDTCQLNLAQDKIRMFWRATDGTVFGNFPRLAEWLQERNEKLICATNAGIYGKDSRPIGLYVEDGHLLRKLNTRKEAYGNFYLQPNGVFLLMDREAVILSTDEFALGMDSLLPNIHYATQSGPILMRNGQINGLFTEGSGNLVVRNAVCTVTPTNIVLVKSRNKINFYDFAGLLRDLLGCRDALYLDGSVSQLYPYDNTRIGPDLAGMIGTTVPVSP